MRVLPLGIVLLFSIEANAQKSHLGSWNVINTRLTLAPHWEVFNELQLRSQSMYHDHFYYEVKGGVSYYFNKNFAVLIGTGRYITYSDPGSFTKPITGNEIRLWQQVTMNNYLTRVKFEHRYRVEQRWFKTGYRNRFRYRINTALPVGKKKIESKTFYLAAFNEIFLTNKAPYFERNRLFAGFGYQFNSNLSLQPGYVYQFDYRNGTGTGKNFFQLTLMIDVDGAKNPYEHLPTNVD
ncbi:MAG: DUF2490 domain-containing protein [Chitinophagaceae bacterium]